MDNTAGVASQLSSEELLDIFIDLHHEKLPFQDESCEIVRSGYYLEHSNLELTGQEVHRVLNENGIFENICPYALLHEWMYLVQNIFLIESWFRENILFQGLFEIIDFEYRESSPYKNWPKFLYIFIPFKFARTHFFNVANEVKQVARKKYGYMSFLVQISIIVSLTLLLQF